MIKNKKGLANLKFARPFLAADPGFEPGQNESESLVLPLHKSATSDNIIPLKINIVKSFFEKN